MEGIYTTRGASGSVPKMEGIYSTSGASGRIPKMEGIYTTRRASGSVPKMEGIYSTSGACGSVPKMEGIYTHIPFLGMYLLWHLCTLYLLACQVRVAIGDSGLCFVCMRCLLSAN